MSFDALRNEYALEKLEHVPNLIIGIHEMYLQLHQPLFIGCVASQVAVIDRFCFTVNILKQCANR